MSGTEDKPPRRPRYRGKNPRRFAEKYKEHAPERYPDTVARVIAGGKTPAGSHVPIMVDECLAALGLQPGQTGVDATLGYGGHAARILERITPGGRLFGLDVDPLELPKTAARLRAMGFDQSVFVAVRSNYAGIAKVLAARDIGAVDFVFADLGCSSMQYDDPARGFSFKQAGPLDMRMNPGRGLGAADWLVKVPAEKLELALHEHADEPRAELLGAALAGRRFNDTLALADAVRAAVGDCGDNLKDLTVRRVFQAVRIAVNEEFTALEAFLRVLPSCLGTGGRAAFLTFHSGEDRRVKKSFQAGLRAGVYARLNEEVVTAGPAERRLNPRSSAAKIRWAVKA